MANPRGELLLRCVRHQPVPLWQTILTVSVGSAAFVAIGGLITGYWALMLGTVALMVVLATPVFLYMSRPVAVYENGIVAGSFRRWNDVASIHLWEYGTGQRHATPHHESRGGVRRSGVEFSRSLLEC